MLEYIQLRNTVGRMAGNKVENKVGKMDYISYTLLRYLIK
jgi:hypothetical protein